MKFKFFSKKDLDGVDPDILKMSLKAANDKRAFVAKELQADGWQFDSEGSACDFYKKVIQKSFGPVTWYFEYGLGAEPWHRIYFNKIKQESTCFSGSIHTLGDYRRLLTLLHIG